MRQSEDEGAMAAGTEADGSRRSWREAADQVRERAGQAASGAKDEARRMAAEASQAWREAKGRASTAYDRTTEGADRAYRSARSYAKENPGATAAITFAAGVGIGILVARRQNAYTDRRGVIPMLAKAVGQAVREVFETQASRWAVSR